MSARLILVCLLKFLGRKVYRRHDVRIMKRHPGFFWGKQFPFLHMWKLWQLWKKRPLIVQPLVNLWACRVHQLGYSINNTTCKNVIENWGRKQVGSWLMTSSNPIHSNTRNWDRVYLALAVTGRISFRVCFGSVLPCTMCSHVQPEFFFLVLLIFPVYPSLLVILMLFSWCSFPSLFICCFSISSPTPQLIRLFTRASGKVTRFIVGTGAARHNATSCNECRWRDMHQCMNTFPHASHGQYACHGW